MREPEPEMKRYISFAFAIVAIAILLEAAGRVMPVSPYWPRPGAILKSFVVMLADMQFAGDVIRSLIRLLVGYLFAVALGITLGALVSLKPGFQLVRPLIEFMRPLPVPAIIPIAIVFFGVGNAMKIFTIVFACIWPIILASSDAVKNVDGMLLDVSQVYGIRGWARFSKVLLPASQAQIISGLRVSLSIALIGVLLSEMIGQVDGIGSHLVYFQRTFQTDKVYATLLLTAFLGYGLNQVFVGLENRVLFWRRLAETKAPGAL